MCFMHASVNLDVSYTVHRYYSKECYAGTSIYDHNTQAGTCKFAFNASTISSKANYMKI